MKSIVLLSGGLDSLVSLAWAKKESEVVLALTFDYGQKAAQKEISAAKQIALAYNVPHEIIKLPWLAQITNTSLVSKKADIPFFTERDIVNRIEITQESAKAVWVPNRNAVFVNIAGSFAESLPADMIVAGFNSEEAATFPDNSLQFVNTQNNLFRLSTMSKPKVLSYVQTYNKRGIVNVAVKLNVPFNLIYSCYRGETDKMCGRCESCVRVKRAFKDTGNYELIKDRFEEDPGDAKK